MREILSRGKCYKNGEWIYGNLLIKSNDTLSDYLYQIVPISMHEEVSPFDFVFPGTVGQYTGLTDKNGTKIFEGDVIRGLFLHSRPINSVVSFQDGAFGLLWNRAGVEIFWAFTSICNVEYEVIGNIHDNPELLKGGAQE